MSDGPHTRRWPLAVGLVLLSPLCAEYVIGYDTSTGDPAALLAGLLIFGPLYGAPALLIREVARRSGMGWPGLLALAGAAGVAQAGLYDQSLFSTSYRDIDYWDEMLLPTFMAPLGISGYTALAFVVGHAVWSFGIPIALVEALRPRLAPEPWLRRTGFVVATLLYLAAAALIYVDHQQNEVDHASPGQMVGAAVVIAMLVTFALTVGRRPVPLGARPTRQGRRVPAPWVVGVMAATAALAFNLMPSSWLGVGAGVVILLAVVACTLRVSGTRAWTPRHVVALATGALAARAAIGFLAVPLGDVAPAAKYAHNVVFLAGALALGAWAARRSTAR